MSSEDVEKCPICAEPLYSLPDRPVPVNLQSLFVPQQCFLHTMHAACARAWAKTQRIAKMDPIACPLCKTAYSEQDLKCLLPPRRKITYETEVSPLDDTSSYTMRLFEHYNPNITTFPTSELWNSAVSKISDYHFINFNLPEYREVYLPVGGSQKYVLDRILLEQPQQQQQQQQQQEEPQTNDCDTDLEKTIFKNALKNFQDLQKNLQTLSTNVRHLKTLREANKQVQNNILRKRVQKQQECMQHIQQTGRRITRSSTKTLSTLTRFQNKRMCHLYEEVHLINNMESRIASIRGVTHGFNSKMVDYMMLMSARR